jgi:hypothetical protein
MSKHFAPSALQKLAVAGVIAVVALVLDLELVAIAALLVGVYVLFVYKNQNHFRNDTTQNSVVAPIDAIVKNIEETQDSYRITLESSLFDNALAKAPCAGEVKEVALIHGTRLSSSSKLFHTLNEHLFIVIKSEENEVAMTHRLKRSVFGIENYVQKGQTLESAQLYATALASVTTIEVSKPFRIDVTEGMRLYTSQTILGYFGE